MSDLLERLAALPVEGLALLNLRLRTEAAGASTAGPPAASSRIPQLDRGGETDLLAKVEQLSDAEVEDLLRLELTASGDMDVPAQRSVNPGCEAGLLERLDQLSDEDVDALLRTLVGPQEGSR